MGKKYDRYPIAVDFDGTIVTHEYPGIGQGIGALKWLQLLQEAGADLILFTMRSGKELEEAVEYCRGGGIEFYGINENPTQSRWTDSPKAYAKVYIDDAAFGCPLIKVPGKRAYVDWDIVGPVMLEALKS